MGRKGLSSFFLRSRNLCVYVFSILQAINRLESDPDPQTISIVQVLRTLLTKQRKKEATTTSRDIINIDD